MEHTKDKHFENINLLCRVCGNFCQSLRDKKNSRKPYPVGRVLKELKFITGYTLATGDSFSKYVCHMCHISINMCYRRVSEKTQESIKQVLKSSEHYWVEFDSNTQIDNCASSLSSAQRSKFRKFSPRQSEPTIT